MILSEWLAYINTVTTCPIDLDLMRMNTMAARLELLHWNCPVITVAGTNGKGSCVTLSAAILHAAGYRVGSYLSPHLCNYQERICINGQPVKETEICEAFEKIEALRNGVSLTYFEFGTLAAFLIFKQARLEALVLEVGLGGRLDAVNSIDADLAIISSIDLDHMDWLGPTREHIAREKAGIMRAGKPCVWGDPQLFASASRTARDLNVPLYCQNKAFGGYETQDNTWTWWNQTQQLHHLPRPHLYLANASCVLQAMFLLRDQFHIPQQAIIQGLKTVFLPGRFQVIRIPVLAGSADLFRNRGLVTHILDIAHNPASACLLAEQMKTLPAQGRCFAVVGMLITKDILRTLLPLITCVDTWHVATLAVTKGASAEQVADCLTAHHIAEVHTHPDVSAAYKAANHAAQPGDRILVFGSFHTVAEVMQCIKASDFHEN